MCVCVRTVYVRMYACVCMHVCVCVYVCACVCVKSRSDVARERGNLFADEVARHKQNWSQLQHQLPHQGPLKLLIKEKKVKL